MTSLPPNTASHTAFVASVGKPLESATAMRSRARAESSNMPRYTFNKPLCDWDCWGPVIGPCRDRHRCKRALAYTSAY